MVFLVLGISMTQQVGQAATSTKVWPKAHRPVA
jgi:hypothetical protein